MSKNGCGRSGSVEPAGDAPEAQVATFIAGCSTWCGSLPPEHQCPSTKSRHSSVSPTLRASAMRSSVFAVRRRSMPRASSQMGQSFARGPRGSNELNRNDIGGTLAIRRLSHDAGALRQGVLAEFPQQLDQKRVVTGFDLTTKLLKYVQTPLSVVRYARRKPERMQGETQDVHGCCQQRGIDAGQ
jgi:hypothetical protein